jgi:hypothetical protein
MYRALIPKTGPFRAQIPAALIVFGVVARRFRDRHQYSSLKSGDYLSSLWHHLHEGQLVRRSGWWSSQKRKQSPTDHLLSRILSVSIM